MSYIQFVKINNHLYFSDDGLYTIRKNGIAWYVYCTSKLIFITEELSAAKDVVKAIRTVLFHNVKIEDCI